MGTGLIEKYTDASNTQVECTKHGGVHKNKYTSEEKKFVMNSEPSYTIVETIEQETNTYKYGVTLADTWFAKVSKEIKKEDVQTSSNNSNGELISGTYKYSTERTTSGNAAISDIKDSATQNQIKDNLNSTITAEKQKIPVPIISTAVGTTPYGSLVIKHNLVIRSVVISTPSYVLASGSSTITKYPNSTECSIPLNNTINENTRITVRDANGNTFEFKGLGEIISQNVNVSTTNNLKLVTYEYTKTDEQTSTSITTTKYPIGEEKTQKSMYDKKDAKFLKAYDESDKARGNMSSTPGWLEDMLDKFDSKFTTIIDYLLDSYYGRDTSEYDMESILDLYDIDSFKSIGYGQLGQNSLYNYMRAWECSELYKYYIGESKTCPKYVDGEYYKVYYGGASDPTYNVAYGIVISRNYNDGYFSRKKVSASTLRSYTTDGGKFTALKGKEVEEIFQMIVDQHKNFVESKVVGLNLSQEQINALVAIKYQYGNIGNFREVYNTYFLKNDIEGFKKNFKDTQGYQPLLDTSTNNKEGRISDRVKANLNLFLNGNYVDMGGKPISNAGGSASDVANYALIYVGRTGAQMSSVIGFSGEWCAAFACHCYKKMGLIPAVIDKTYTYCADLMNYAKSKGIWHNKGGYTPKSGDMILFDWNYNNNPDHVGLVVSCDGSNVYTVEGNTGGGDSWRTRQVNKKTWAINSVFIMGYISPSK